MERLTLLLEKLRMDHLELQLDAVCEHAAQKELDYKSFLIQALEAEWNGRYQKGSRRDCGSLVFPGSRPWNNLILTFSPVLTTGRNRELAGLSFVERAHNVVILGPPGVGKTHLSIGLGVKAVEAAIRYSF